MEGAEIEEGVHLQETHVSHSRSVTDVVQIRPRRKAGEAAHATKKNKDTKLEFKYGTISKYFGMRLSHAARELGISPTSLKHTCRKLGIQQWPYPRGGPDRLAHVGPAAQVVYTKEVQMHHRAEYVPALACQTLISSSSPDFVNGLAVPAKIWLTPNKVTEMAESCSTFWDMGWLSAPSAYLDEQAVRATEGLQVDAYFVQ